MTLEDALQKEVEAEAQSAEEPTGIKHVEPHKICVSLSASKKEEAPKTTQQPVAEPRTSVDQSGGGGGVTKSSEAQIVAEVWPASLGAMPGMSDVASSFQSWQASMPSMGTLQQLEVPSFQLPTMNMPSMSLFQVPSMPSMRDGYMAAIPAMPTMPSVSLDMHSFPWANTAAENSASTQLTAEDGRNPSTGVRGGGSGGGGEAEGKHSG
jgi:hypothetical protein